MGRKKKIRTIQPKTLDLIEFVRGRKNHIIKFKQKNKRHKGIRIIDEYGDVINEATL